MIAAGETHSVREFLEAAFGFLGLDPCQYLVLDQRFLRPAEVDLLLGDASKARLHLGWSARTGFSELVRDMVSSDLDFYSHGKSKKLGDQNPAAASTVPPADAAQGTLQPTTGN